MAKGFLSGAVLGAVTSVAGAGLLSLSVGMPRAVDPPEVAEVEVPAESAFESARDDLVVERPASEAERPSGTAPQINPPARDDLAPLDDADTTPAATPDPDMGAASLAAPEENPQAAEMNVGRESSAPASAPAAAAPVAPEAEANLSVSTEPAAPPVVPSESAPPPEDSLVGLVPPEDTEDDTLIRQNMRAQAGNGGPMPQPWRPGPDDAMFAAPSQPAVPIGGDAAPPQVADTPPSVSVSDLSEPAAPEGAPDAGDAEQAYQPSEFDAAPYAGPAPAPAASGKAQSAQQLEQGQSGVAPIDAGQDEPAPGDAALPDTSEATEGAGTPLTPAPVPDAADTELNEPQQDGASFAAIDVDSDGPSMQPPVEQADEQAPLIGKEPAQPMAPETGRELLGDVVISPRVPPLERYAAPFHAAGDKPLMSVVLIDDGSGPLGPRDIGAFPYPLTVALDAAAPGAFQRMKRYREQGVEVMALADLPPDATPEEARADIQAVLERLPEIVAVLEGTGTGLKGAPEVASGVVEHIAQSGHGLVLLPQGRNAAQPFALPEKMPSVSVFRDLDGQGQGAAVVRRFLEHAASRAGQNGPVVLLGRLRPDTVSSLRRWGSNGPGSAAVDIVPISSLLLQSSD